ncbi:MAG TPA: hypothetical protein VIJ57_12865 [Hanamia sp.]
MQLGKIPEPYYKSESEIKVAAEEYLNCILQYLPTPPELFEVQKILNAYSKTLPNKALEFKKVSEIGSCAENILIQYSCIKKPENKDAYGWLLTDNGISLKSKGNLQKYLHSVNEAKELPTKLVKAQIEDMHINAWYRKKGFIWLVLGILLATILSLLLLLNKK